jgi:hypothetical protein
VLLGCSSSPLSGADTGSAKQVATAPAVPSAVQLIPLYTPPPKWSASALAFDPTRPGQLWVTLRQFPSNKACTSKSTSGCKALEGEVMLVRDATTASPQAVIRKDGNAWHFMRRPSAIAFGDNGNLASCGEARTDNYEDEAIDYSGPVLWSSDQSIFGASPAPGQNGTHIDMLHESPLCMGIAHDTGNVYWVFNGQSGSLDRNDFHEPHAVGGEDHSDGEVERYVSGQLSRVPEVPSQLAPDSERGELYVADTGHARVVRLAMASGTPGPELEPLDPIKTYHEVIDAQLDEIVAPGTLTLPSGVAYAADTLLVTDNATSQIAWFQRDGTLLGSVDTGLPAGSLAGIAIGPDGQLYLSDLLTGNAYRVEAR